MMGMPEYKSAILAVSAIMFPASVVPKVLCIPDVRIVQLTLFVIGTFKKSSKLAAHAMFYSFYQPAHNMYTL